jgi:hypothetical protein
MTMRPEQEGAMNTLKRMLKPLLNDLAPTERFSLRVKDGVEIYEHESRRTYKISATTGVTEARTAPRLIVAEPVRYGNRLIAKTRSEIAGLTALLKAVTATR